MWTRKDKVIHWFKGQQFRLGQQGLMDEIEDLVRVLESGDFSKIGQLGKCPPYVYDHDENGESRHWQNFCELNIGTDITNEWPEMKRCQACWERILKEYE